MLLWKAQYGYSSVNAPANISDIQITDEHGFYGVIDGAILGEFYYSGNSPSEAYSNLEKAIGEDVNVLYPIWRRTANLNTDQSKGSIRIMTEAFPSITLGCPNLISILDTLPVSYSFWIIVPGLKRAFMSGNAGTKIFIIDNGNLVDNTPSYAYTGNTYVVNQQQGGYRSGFNFLVCNGISESLNPTNIKFGQVIVISDYNSQSNYTISSQVADISYIGASSLASNFTAIFGDYSPPDYSPSEDGPYGGGATSGEGDLPPGTFDDSSDVIPDSSLPSISAADTGFTRIYNPTLAQVQSLAKYLWTDDTVLDTIWNHIKQFFEDPMQAIIGFNLVPCRVPDGGTRNFALMYIDTGVQMTSAASQFVDVDCGTLAVERYYGSALDQNPYTRISCYLPFIGTVHLDTDEVMGETLHITYRIDIVSGSCVAKIFRKVGNEDSILYQYSGHCAITVPISSADFATYVSAAVSVGAVAAGLAAGAAAGIGVGAAESEALTVTSADMSAPITESEASALIGGDGGTGVATGASFNGINAANITNTVGQVMGSKLQIEHAGSFSGNSGYLGVRRPYLIINRPNMCLPSLYGHLNGYPSMITLILGECSGFTKVQQVQLTGVTATNPEQAEILQFLKSGVYL